jgi:hypothetical protein
VSGRPFVAAYGWAGGMLSVHCASVRVGAHHDADQYIDRKAVAEEVAYSRRLCAKHNWPSIDVTRRSIEESGSDEAFGRAPATAGRLNGALARQGAGSFRFTACSRVALHRDQSLSW